MGACCDLVARSCLGCGGVVEDVDLWCWCRLAAVPDVVEACVCRCDCRFFAPCVRRLGTVFIEGLPCVVALELLVPRQLALADHVLHLVALHRPIFLFLLC